MAYDPKMLAYCGLYCEQCSFKAAHDEQDDKHLANIPYPFERQDLTQYGCECCKGHCICGPCKIKPCASAKGIASCADCGDFPCDHINAFETDGMPHHMDAVGSLRKIRQDGAEDWYESRKNAFRCACGEKQTWYYTCPLHSEQAR